ncbi:MAG: CHC2 zinc finger domain-containing protein [Nitrospirota bacterium]
MTNNKIKDLRDQVKDNTDIAKIIGERINLNRNNIAICPFHEDNNPSFSVNSKEQYFYCFGCGVGGDVIRFVELFDKKTFIEALRYLADQAGIPNPNMTEDELDRIRKRQEIADILAKAVQYYKISMTPEVKSYLTDQRGINESIIDYFQIGYANGRLHEYLMNKCGFEEHSCIESGLLKKTEDGYVRDLFHHRIIFPVIHRGTIVNISARALNEIGPKYLHLPGKINHLFNEEALHDKEIILTEGIIDCLTAIQAGYSAVATLGSCGFKEDFVPKFDKCRRVFICFDADEAGRNGATKTVELLGSKSRLITLPDNFDLNEYFRSHNKEQFDSLKQSALDLIQYQIGLIPKDIGKPELSEQLYPILETLSKEDIAKAESYLSYEIGKRFNLKSNDLDAYRKKLNIMRKEISDSSREKIQSGKTTITASFEGLIDLVEDYETTAFLVKDEAAISIINKVEIDGKLFIPPNKGAIPWLLPQGQEVMKYHELEQKLPNAKSDEAIYDDIVNYLQNISELPSAFHYDFLAAWVMHTYLIEPVQYSPIICLFAVPERGKTRTGKSLIYLAYRGVHVESLRDPYIVRLAENFGSTIFFDVKDVWRKAEKSGSEDILLMRYEKGALVPRVQYPDRGAYEDTVYYKIFGPTIIGTNESLDKILETRAVVINMPETSRQFENDVTPENALPLKERLLLFRARHLGEKPPDVSKPAEGRLGDILRPIYQIIRIVKPANEDGFLQFVKGLKSARAIEKSTSLEAEIVQAIINLPHEVKAGALAVKIATDKVNENRPERYRVTYQRIGRILSALGFTKGKAGDGASVILWDDNLISKLKTNYGLELSSVSSETSEISENETEVTDESDVSDVLQRSFI